MSERNLMPQQRMAELQARAERMRAENKAQSSRQTEADRRGAPRQDDGANMHQTSEPGRQARDARAASDDELHEIDVRERKKRITVMLVAEIIVAAVFIVGVVAFAGMTHGATIG